MNKIQWNISIHLLCLFCFFSLTLGQSSLNNTNVTLNCKNQPLRKVLQEITKQTNAKFIFSDVLVDGKTVTFQFYKMPIKQSLQEITEQSKLSFKIQSNKLIVLFKKKFKPSSGNMISGCVIDDSSKICLPGANVFLTETTFGASTNEKGKFIISNIPNGCYNLQCMYIGYKTVTINDINISENKCVHLDIEMRMEPIRLKEITVTPSHYSFREITPTVQQTLTRKDIETIPQFGEDIYRVVRRLPGLYANEFSSRFTVRGGEHNQILTTIDGLELYEPFHLKDIFGGLLSIIDAAAIETIDLMTGGFSAEYGDRMSGVFKIKSRIPTADQKRYSLGISLTNARIFSEGSFNKNNGSWLISGRRGYLNNVLKITGGDDTQPGIFYYDLFGKVKNKLNEKNTLSVNVLHANDKFEYINDGVDTHYSNTYGWLTLQSVLNPKLLMRTVVSVGRMSHNRKAIRSYDVDQDLYYSVSDVRNFQFWGFKQDWNLEFSGFYYVKWGFDTKMLTSEYDYLSVPQNDSYDVNTDIKKEGLNTTQVTIDPSGQKFGAYLSNRFEITSPLTAEIGFRYDYTSYTKDNLFSPRVNLAYALGRQTFIRGEWGHFYQTQGVHELHVQDGEESFSPAELAEHRIIGFEHDFNGEIRLRLEGYYKKMSNLRPVYQNWKQIIDIFPEMSSDRLKILLNGSTAKGIEIYLRKISGEKLTWTV